MSTNQARRNRIIMVKRDIPKRVNLPNGRTFLAHFKRKTRAHLPANIHIERPYKECPALTGKRRRRRAIAQHEQRIRNIFRFVKKDAKSMVGQDIRKMTLE